MQRALAIVVDYNTTESACALTLQLVNSNTENIELTVVHVDNGNELRVHLSDEQKNAGIHLHRVHRNLGYASGLMSAIAHFDNRLNTEREFDLYWFLNSDLEVDANCADELAQAFSENPLLGACGPRVFRNREKTEVWGARGVVSPWLGTTAMTDWTSPDALPRWSYIPGSSLMVNAKAYRQVGGLTKKYRLYYEETELCVFLQKMHWELRVIPTAHAIHHVQSQPERIPAPHFAYFFVRNQLLFWKRTFGIPALIQFPRTAFVWGKEVILPLRRAKGFAHALRILSYSVAGLIDSIPFTFFGFSFFEYWLFRMGHEK